jgi:hypothetical protein
MFLLFINISSRPTTNVLPENLKSFIVNLDFPCILVFPTPRELLNLFVLSYHSNPFFEDLISVC